MFSIKYKRFGLLPMKVHWFNQDHNVELNDSGINRVRQSVRIENIKNQYQIRETPIKTFIINLKFSEDNLWKNLNRKHKSNIKKMQKLVASGSDIKIKKNTEVKTFLDMANYFIQVKKYRKPISLSELNRYLKSGKGELVAIYNGDEMLGGIFFLLDYPFRVRCLYGFNDRYRDLKNCNYYPYYMKYLHWMAMLNYKLDGYEYYDFGGTSGNNPGIALYKRGFGGRIITEYDYEFASNKILKVIYPKITYTKQQRELIKSG